MKGCLSRPPLEGVFKLVGLASQPCLEPQIMDLLFANVLLHELMDNLGKNFYVGT